MDRLLDHLSRALALAGALVLLAAAAMTVVSVLGRWWLARPVLGDVELMQLACAVAIALFLPYCQRQRGHVAVSFFTAQLAPSLQRVLAVVAHAMAAVVLLLLAWRAAVAVADMHGAGETSMVLGVPYWLAYLAMVPGLALSSVVAMAAAMAAALRPAHAIASDLP